MGAGVHDHRHDETRTTEETVTLVGHHLPTRETAGGQTTTTVEGEGGTITDEEGRDSAIATTMTGRQGETTGTIGIDMDEEATEGTATGSASEGKTDGEAAAVGAGHRRHRGDLTIGMISVDESIDISTDRLRFCLIVVRPDSMRMRTKKAELQEMLARGRGGR